MHYKMYEEMMEQPRSLKDTMEMENSHMKGISEKIKEFDKIYLVGCGSSLSTCFSSKDAMNIISNRNLEVYTGYEFFYHKNLQNENAGVILTSQSGETADTLAALRRAQNEGMYTVSIINEEKSTMMQESDEVVLTRCNRETAILGTKTYMTQLMCLYQILFNMENSPDAQDVLKDLEKIPAITEDLLKK
ncbi:MAG: SIS domain-containing protein, partial [Methanobacterium sp.]